MGSSGKARRFATTRWSLVLAARQPTPESREALETLCRLYWGPLHAFVATSRRGADDAADLTQAFFARLLEKNDLAAAAQERGRFRSWLLASMKHFLANDWHHTHAQKRGGGEVIVSLDADPEEGHARVEPAGDLDPEKLYEQKWALSVIERALATVEAQYAHRGQRERFNLLKGAVTTGDCAPYEELGAQLDLTANAVKQAVSRLRKDVYKVIRAAIADTVEAADGDAEVADEFDQLIAAL